MDVGGGQGGRGKAEGESEAEYLGRNIVILLSLQVAPGRSRN